MIANTKGARAAVASLVLCLMLLASTAPSSAVLPVTGTDGGGGACRNCGNSQQQNAVAGTASNGSASNNGDGSGSSYDMTYGVPNDGQMYSGTLMTQVVNADGSVTIQTWPISDFANGNTNGYAAAWNSAMIPAGGTASITVNESAPNGASFSAGYTVRNYGH